MFNDDMWIVKKILEKKGIAPIGFKNSGMLIVRTLQTAKDPISNNHCQGMDRIESAMIRRAACPLSALRSARCFWACLWPTPCRWQKTDSLFPLTRCGPEAWYALCGRALLWPTPCRWLKARFLITRGKV
jgi:hypothetical protein